jgi:probable F420-dependent oxidoreductase
MTLPRIGISLMSADTAIRPDVLARAVEERGFESLWLPEHSHIPVSRESPWPGSLTGAPLPDEYSRLHDVFVALSMAAAVTTKIHLGTSVLLMAQRDAIWTAKQVATLDHLSGGRVEVGVGIGWNREEMASHGTARYADRWTLTRERVAAMRELWSSDVASYTGSMVTVPPSWQWPKPASSRVKIHLGGGAGPRLLGEVATWADGWMPVSARDSLASRLAKLREACDRVGRDVATVEVTVPWRNDIGCGT